MGRQPRRARLRGDGRPAADPDPLPARRVPAAVRPARRLVEHRRQHLGRHHLLGAALPQAGRRQVLRARREGLPAARPRARSRPASPSTARPRSWSSRSATATHGFTLDRETYTFVLTHPDIRIPPDTQEFAINVSNQRRWEPPVRRYIDECLAGKDGPRGKDFNMRWVASMVADVFRVLSRGGIFMYPRDSKNKDGRLRLMYEANPMALHRRAGRRRGDRRARPASSTSSRRPCTSAWRWSSARRTRSTRSPRTTNKKAGTRPGLFHFSLETVTSGAG